MFEGLMLILGFTGLAYFGQKWKVEQEMQDDELENMRHYLLDKYQDELKRKYSENDFDYTANIMDFCLKLRNMDNETLKKVYGMVKDAEGNHLLMKYEIRECGVWPNYFKVLDDEQETGKSDE